jgi:pantetheine-phosphate adenylyltransferase
MKTAVYPGSLDPVTFGHIEAVRDAAAAFDRVVVAIGINPAKKNYLFSLSERESLARRALEGLPNVRVDSFSGLLVRYLIRNDWNIVVRGLRGGQDLEDAMLQDTIGWQQPMAQDLRAFYIPARPGQKFISSTILKGVVQNQGNAALLAPLSSVHATQARFVGQYVAGITGPSGAGKSHLSRRLRAAAEKRGLSLHHIDLDKLGHAVLDTDTTPLYVKTRQAIRHAFGDAVVNPDGSINRRELGTRVFGDQEKLRVLNALMHDPIFFRLTDQMLGQKGLFLLDAALLAEANKLPSVHNNVILVNAKDSVRARRLTKRDGLTAEAIERRLKSQSAADKASLIAHAQKRDRYGTTLRVNRTLTDNEVETLLDRLLEQVDLYGELRLTGFFRKAGLADPEAAYHAARALYQGNDRFYHAWAHIVDGLNLLPLVADQLADPEAFMLGWIFHDAVYNTQSATNEEDSAKLMRRQTTAWGFAPAVIDRAAALIMATKHGHVTPTTNDARLIADLDTLILGQSSKTYARYAQNVRREYAWVADADWRKGRGAFLTSLAAPLYRTPALTERFEAQARRNIAAKLRALTPR